MRAANASQDASREIVTGARNPAADEPALDPSESRRKRTDPKKPAGGGSFMFFIVAG